MPFVSVIIPNYNHARYLHQRIQTVLAQTYQDYEVIILDDCSSDASREIIEGYRGHPKVSSVVYNETNSGSTFKQWRKGLELAKGEWIWVAESDDFCAVDFLQVLVGKVSSRDNIVLGYCQSNEVDEKGEGWRTMLWYTDTVDEDHWKKDYDAAGTDEIKEYLWHFNSIPNASAVIFKKGAYIAANKSFEAMKLCGDWMLWVQLMKQGGVTFSARALNSFRQHGATTRVFEDNDKKKAVEEEKYIVARDIQNSVMGLHTPSARKKIQKLIRIYCTHFSVSEVVRYLLNPASYKKPIPFFQFISIYFARLAAAKTKNLLSVFK